MAVFEIGKISIQSDKVNSVGTNEWEIVSFKRALVDGYVNDQNGSSTFALILDARANTIVINARKCHRGAGNIAIALRHALRRLTAHNVDVLSLPPGAVEAKETLACGVDDAMHVAGLLHTLRDIGGFGEAPTASFYIG